MNDTLLYFIWIIIPLIVLLIILIIYTSNVDGTPSDMETNINSKQDKQNRDDNFYDKFLFLESDTLSPSSNKSYGRSHGNKSYGNKSYGNKSYSKLK